MGVCFLAVVSCHRKMVEKPKNLIPPKQMEVILYDAALRGAAQKHTEQGTVGNTTAAEWRALYKKHGVDSAQLAVSIQFYAARPGEYAALYQRVAARLQEAKEKAEAAQKKPDSLPPKTIPKERKLLATDSAAMQ